MNMMVSELYDALMSAGADEGKARRAAESSATSYEDTRKQFAELREDNQRMRTEMAALRGDLRTEMQALRTEMQGLRGELSLVKWMGGVLIGLAVAILIKVLFV